MGIEVYEGVLGGGKSYHAVLHALEYLAHGGRVYTNITLVQSACEEWVRSRYGVDLEWSSQYHFLTGADMPRLHQVVVGGTSESPTLCILDEIHLYHNARDWASASRGLLQWLTQSRKLHVDIICITQHRNNLDKQWVRLVYCYWRFRDLRKFRLPKIGIKVPFFQCLATSFDIDGRTQLHRRWERFDNSVFKCYSSEQLFDGVSDFAGSGLKRIDLKKSKVRVRLPRWALVALLCGLSALVFSGCKFFGPLFARKDAVSSSPDTLEVVSSSPSSEPPTALPAPISFGPPEKVSCDSYVARSGRIVAGSSSRWRLLFEGKPDGQDDNGLPQYLAVRGTAF